MCSILFNLCYFSIIASCHLHYQQVNGHKNRSKMVVFPIVMNYLSTLPLMHDKNFEYLLPYYREMSKMYGENSDDPLPQMQLTHRRVSCRNLTLTPTTCVFMHVTALDNVPTTVCIYFSLLCMMYCTVQRSVLLE